MKLSTLPVTLVVSVLLVLCLPGFVTPLIDQICVNVGYENLPASVSLYKLVGGTYNHPAGVSSNEFCKALFRFSPYDSLQVQESGASIGGKKFGTQHKGSATLSFHKETLGLLPLPSNFQLPDCCDVSANSYINILTYGVKYDNKYLNGWMSIRININVEVTWAFVQVSDERGNAIGEFLDDTCGLPGLDITFPKKEQFLPCSATGLQEAKPSQSFVYTKKDFITGIVNPNDADAYMASPVNADLKMDFMWKLNEYFCNRHMKFRVVLYVLTEKGANDSFNPTTIFARGDWYYPKWYGAADIVPPSAPGTPLPTPSCSKTDQITQQFIVQNKDFWIKGIKKSIPANDNLNPEKEGPSFPETLYKSCRTYLTRLQEHTDDVKRQPSYGGRCEKIDEKKFKPSFYKSSPHSTSSVSVPHQCLKNDKAEYPGKMIDYQKYKEDKIKARESLCTKKAEKCPNLKNLTVKKIQNAIRGHPGFNATGSYIMKSRAFHGMTLTWAALFFIPISNFMARFFKETFLSTDFVGVRVWYFVHIGFTFMVINVSISGLISNGKVTRVWGRSWSQAGATHRGMGWFCVVLYVLVIIMGPLRPERHRPRLIVMALHSFLGYFQYLMGLFVVMNSTLIPGSPSATKCYKKIPSFDPFVSPGFGDMYNHEIATSVTWWIFLDLFFYGLMSLMQWSADRSWQVHRRYYFPLVPIVRYGDRRSFKCFRYRTLVLIVYVFILSVIMIITTKHLYETDWRECDCGPMTCTHASISPESAYREVKCGRLVELRQAINKRRAEGTR